MKFASYSSPTGKCTDRRHCTAHFHVSPPLWTSLNSVALHQFKSGLTLALLPDPPPARCISRSALMSRAGAWLSRLPLSKSPSRCSPSFGLAALLFVSLWFLRRLNFHSENRCGAICQSSLEFIAVPAPPPLPLTSLVPNLIRLILYYSSGGSDSPSFFRPFITKTSFPLPRILHLHRSLTSSVSFLFFLFFATSHRQLIASRCIFCPPPHIRFCSSQKRWKWNKTKTGMRSKCKYALEEA